MAVELSLLVGRLQASLNAPGESFFTFTPDQGVQALANGFWWARLRGFFPNYRVTADGSQIVPVDGDDDLSDVEQQVVVCWTALVCLENKLAGLTLSEKYTAGPVSSSEERSSTLLRDLVRARRAELETLKEELIGTGRETTVAFIDTVQARTAALAGGDQWWVR